MGQVIEYLEMGFTSSVYKILTQPFVPFITFVNSLDPDQPAQPSRLIRIYSVCFLIRNNIINKKANSVDPD
jgi:hypothetical protein